MIEKNRSQWNCLYCGCLRSLMACTVFFTHSGCVHPTTSGYIQQAKANGLKFDTQQNWSNNCTSRSLLTNYIQRCDYCEFWRRAQETRLVALRKKLYRTQKMHWWPRNLMAMNQDHFNASPSSYNVLICIILLFEEPGWKWIELDIANNIKNNVVS